MQYFLLKMRYFKKSVFQGCGKKANKVLSKQLLCIRGVLNNKTYAKSPKDYGLEQISCYISFVKFYVLTYKLLWYYQEEDYNISIALLCKALNDFAMFIKYKKSFNTIDLLWCTKIKTIVVKLLLTLTGFLFRYRIRCVMEGLNKQWRLILLSPFLYI